MSYLRVLPRDLFNEAKLLKCLGQLALAIHHGEAPGLSLEFENESDTQGFRIFQDYSDGSLYCHNLVLRRAGIRIEVRAVYNSRDPYPLLFLGEEGPGSVFQDNGPLSEEFLHYLQMGSFPEE